MRMPVAPLLAGAALLAELMPSAATAQPAPVQRAQPRAELNRFFYPPDQPEAAPDARGTTAVRLTIGVDGRVTGCQVRASSGSAVLDSTTCRLLRSRARFTPARDSAGLAMEDRYDAAIEWPPTGAGIASNSAPPPMTSVRVAPPPVVNGNTPPLPSVIDARPVRPVERARARGSLQGLLRPDDYPQSALAAGEQGVAAFALVIGADGRVNGCTITRSSGSAALDRASCSILRSRARYTPARGANGQPMEDVQQAYLSWTLPAR